jgi:hypothetical protein
MSATQEEVKTTTAKEKITTAPDTRVVLNLANPTKVLFTITSSGEHGERMLHDAKLALSKGLTYKLPITNSDISTKTGFGIKHDFAISDVIRILNVDKGFVTIEAIVHGYIILDGLVLGSLF